MPTAITFAATLTRPDGTTQPLTATTQLLDPAPRVALGHWRNQPAESGAAWRTRMDAAEAQFGPFAGHWRDYLGVGSSGQLSAAHRQALADGKRLFINWKPWSTNWAQVASGARDPVIIPAAQSWAAPAGPAGDRWVCFGHEPENDGGAPADFIAMFRRTATLFRQYAPAVKIAWVCMGFDVPTSARYWPGAAYVDLLCHDPYITKGVAAAEMANRIIDRTGDLRQALPDAAGLPVVVAEWGPDLGGDLSTERGTDQHRADAINGVRARLADIAAAGVVELCYFDARTDYLTAAGPDAAAYSALKAATER